MTLERIAAVIRTIPDYPKPGIAFRDITPLFEDAAAFHSAVTMIADQWRAARPDKIAGLEARGFIVGAAVAYELRAGFVPLRKKGKLPRAVFSAEYQLEYGTDVLQVHTDAVKAGERVVVIDDLIATGGTAMAAVSLLAQLNATVLGVACVINLPELRGTALLAQHGLRTQHLVSFAGH